MKNKKMTLDVNEKPPLAKWLILAIQHVFAMFGATILVPILVNTAAGETVLTIPVALVTSGIGTLIYILCTKGKSPVYLGSSFAFIAPIAAAYTKGGISGAMTGIMIVGLIYIIVSFIIKLIGKNWINKLLPPVIIGPMIMIIGLGLAPSAISQMGLAAGSTLEWKVVLVAIVAFLVTTVVMTRAKGFLKVIPFLIGIISAYILSAILGMVDFTAVKEANFFSLPHFIVPFVSYKLNFAAILTIAPIALVTMCEHIGDHISLSNIIDKDLTKDPGLDRTMLGDGVATFIAGLLGGPANTTYGENTSVVGLTKVASVWVIGLAAIIAIIVGFLGKFTALVSTIPSAVLGGVSLLLYGFIAVNGLKVLIKNQVNFEKAKNVIVASSMLVLGLGGAAVALSTGDLEISFSGMSLAAIIGIILNLVIPDEKEENTPENANLNNNTKKEETSKKENSKEIEDELNRLKNNIKEELTIELKSDIIKAIKEELNSKEQPKNKISNK